MSNEMNIGSHDAGCVERVVCGESVLWLHGVEVVMMEIVV